jgi:hypothetical protein
MSQKLPLWVGLQLVLISSALQAQSNAAPTARVSPPQPMISVQTTNDLGLASNGPAVTHLFKITQSWTNERAFLSPTPALATNPAYLRMRQSSSSWTNAVFESFRPDSLNNAVWTNFMARTNGRDMQIWSERHMPQVWTNRPTARWNTNSVIWGMKGLTALSPAWQVLSGSGQVPFTLLTRRHAYARGHGLGPEGFQTADAGRKIWFLTRDNVLVEAVIKRHVTRASTTNGIHRDYSIFLFDRDLPDTIESMSAAPLAEIQTRYRFPAQFTWPCPIFQTEQSGMVSTGIAPLVVNTWKPGDSGSPDMIPLPGELVFFGGRSTSGPSREMQEDMDELCRLEHLDPKKYQLRRPDFSKYLEY